MRIFFSIFLCLLSVTSISQAQECQISKSLLIASCNNPLSVKLRVLPDDTEPDSTHLLTVAGTYSSADRFGVEGLAIKNGEIISRRYQNWDGVLIITDDGLPRVFHAEDINIESEKYNLKEKSSREAFLKNATKNKFSVLQSHLLIRNKMLDLEDVENAPRFKRRLLVILEDESFGIWETRAPETLYEAARQLQDDLNPKMALNLDMGAYDYCFLGPVGVQIDCGNLNVSEDKLTNLLEFSYQ